MASDKDWYRILRGMLRPPVCRGRMRHKPLEGIEAARVRGWQVGRLSAITADQLRAARAMRAAGEPIPSRCRALGVTWATLYKTLSEIKDTA